MTAAIYNLQTKREAQFVCSACGADRSCDCNAPALRRLDELEAAKEKRRQANRLEQQRSREKHKRNQEPVSLTDKEEKRLADEWAFRDTGEFPGSIEDEIEPDNYHSAFLIRADQAVSFATYSGPVSDDVLEAARATALAWNKLVANLEQRHDR